MKKLYYDQSELKTISKFLYTKSSELARKNPDYNNIKQKREFISELLSEVAVIEILVTVENGDSINMNITWNEGQTENLTLTVLDHGSDYLHLMRLDKKYTFRKEFLIKNTSDLMILEEV